MTYGSGLTTVLLSILNLIIMNGNGKFRIVRLGLAVFLQSLKVLTEVDFL